MIKKRTIKSGLVLELDDELECLCLHNAAEADPNGYDFQDCVYADLVAVIVGDEYGLCDFRVADAMKLFDSIYSDFDDEFELPLNWRRYRGTFQPIADTVFDKLSQLVNN